MSARNHPFRLDLVFATEEEATIWNDLKTVGVEFEADCKNGEYGKALSKLAALGPGIDHYFETVMVNVEDQELRANRLGFVRFLVVQFAQIADFSEIVTAG